MAGLAPAADAHAGALRLQRDVGGILQLGDVGLDQCAGAVGHGIVGHAAHELLDDAVADRADQLGTEVALLTVADRELGVRGKAEGRGRVILQVVLHIPHGGLLVVAHEGADGIAQRIALLLEELQGIEDGDHRALIVGHAAADEPAVPDLHLERVARPAVAFGHHVHMADRCQILLGIRAGQLRIADVIFAVAGGKAHPCRQLQRLVQRSACAQTIGGTLGRGTLDTIDGNERLNILEPLVLVRRNECVDLLVQSLIHGWFVLSLS